MRSPGLWPAVVAGDVARVRYWLESQARVLVAQRGRTPLEFASDADSPPMPEVVRLLEAYVHQNEFAFAVLACDRKRMIHYLSLGASASAFAVRLMRHAMYSYYTIGQVCQPNCRERRAEGER